MRDARANGGASVLNAPKLEKGLILATPGRTVGEGDVNLFAGLVGDFTPVHVDEVFARASPFGERIAHGPLAMAMAIGLLTHTGVLGERVIGLVNLNWDFALPVRLGDTIRSRVVVEELRPTAKPGRALATFAFEVINQDGAVVQRGRMLIVVKAE